MFRATVIDHLEGEFLDNSARAFIHFDYQQKSTQNCVNIFSSLLRQLLGCFGPNPWPTDIQKSLNRSCDSRRALDIRELVSLIHRCSKHFEVVFLVFDALDECDDLILRWKVIDFIDSSLRSEQNFRVLLTSRPQLSLNDRLGCSITVDIIAHAADIEKFIRDHLQYVGRRFSTSLKEEIVNTLVGKADGMY